MTDLSAGEHIIDALEIEQRQDEALARVRERVMAAIRSEPPPGFHFCPPNFHRDSRYGLGNQAAAPCPPEVNVRMTLDGDPIAAQVAKRWTLNGEPLNVFDDNHIRRITMQLEPVVERLDTMPSVGNITFENNTLHISVPPKRHPSSQRFHDLLPRVAQMAYRFDAELAPAGASAWGIDAWKVPMRGIDLRLRKLQAVARGDVIAQSPTLLMLEVAALALVAKHYFADDTFVTWGDHYADKMGRTHDDKQADYGRDDDPFANVRASEDWSVAPWVGGMIRLTDKVRRLQTFAIKGSLKNEGVVDSMEDLSVYAVINAVLYDDEQNQAAA